MKLLNLRTNLYPHAVEDIPFTVYTVGTEHQKAIARLKGYSAKQLFVTFSGTGVYRPLGQDKWDTVPPGTLLYIPSGYAHEYLPQGSEDWFVGYVTFTERSGGPLEHWGFGETPFRLKLKDTVRLYERIEAIWSCSGPNADVWESTSELFAFCMEIKRQTHVGNIGLTDAAVRPVRYRDDVVHSAVRFLHDHLQRDLTMAELASYVGYSPKHLNRLFRQSLGMSPLHYLQRLRMKTAALLLAEHPGMTVRQAAAHIGMEPVYFTRLFRRLYGAVPSEFREKSGSHSPSN